MKSPNVNAFLITIMAALAIYFPLATATPESGQQKTAGQRTIAEVRAVPVSSPKAVASESARKSGMGEAAKLLCDFLGQKNQTPDRNRDEGDYCQLATDKRVQDYQIDHLLATIPDPKESRLGYLFDRNLDAIQRAIEALGYVLDRHSLPWDKQKSAQQTSVILPAPPVTATITVLAGNPRRDYTREPGIVLFRKIKGDEHKLLLLFLVGETPTTGIHKNAFRNALDQIRMLAGMKVIQGAHPHDP